ncbi:Zn-dependent alcohol dehydrogenase [Wocania ichthyoenteri]|uniref:Zn-dependent alcohol dehydrogenase n=1 Tax=Wocania ichthyoenteri TaxID=1230531 RepID=UPI00053DDC60|nr:Zn-dependent alcohol dehydrogenase [Wocania ichthyoenteri]
MRLSCNAAISKGNGTFSIETIDIEKPEDEEVIIQIKAASLCHTDLNSLHWGKPLVMGHEGSGIVTQIGKKVRSVAIGDPVILNWATPCGHCYQCHKENEHLCENNSPVIAGSNGYNSGHAHLEGTKWKGQPILRSFNIGTLSEYTLVKEIAVVKNPLPNMSHASASMISCGVMTGFGSVMNVAKITAQDSTVVIGAGGVGLNIIQAAKLCKSKMIVAIDVHENRLAMAKEFGATHTILASKDDNGLIKTSQEVRTLTNGRGADYAFECTGIPKLGAAPLAMIRNAGTAIQVSGIEEQVLIDMTLFEWDKKYINPLYGQCKPQTDFPKIIEYYKQGKLMLDDMVSKTYSIDQLQDAFDDMESGKTAKGVIVFN